MALPNSIDPAAPAGTDQISAGDNQIRALKQFIVDLFGLSTSPTTQDTGITITTSGFVRLASTPSPSIRITDTAEGTGSDHYLELSQGTNSYLIATHSLLLGAGDDNTGQLALYSGGRVGINETSNANMTIGLTINQGANDNEIMAFKSSDVAHGGTTFTETDTFGSFKKQAAASGGLLIYGASASAIGTEIYGISASRNSTHTAAGVGCVNVRAQNTSGAGISANENIFAAATGSDTRFIVDQEGDLFADSGTTTTAVTVYDDYDDAALIRTFSCLTGKDAIKSKWDAFITYNEQALIDAKILGGPLKDRPLYCVTKLQQLQNGAIWQLYTTMQEEREARQQLEAKVLALTGGE